MTSSITATIRTIRPKAVSMIPRSIMIREMTGMAATAIASPTTRAVVTVEPRGPANTPGTSAASAAPAAKGTTSPAAATIAPVRRSRPPARIRSSA